MAIRHGARRHPLWYAAIVLACVLIALRLYAPYWIKDEVNQAIADAPGLKGQVGDVSLSLFRGAYTIDDIELYSVSENRTSPLVSADSLDLSVLWSALLDGKVVAEMQFYQPVLHLLDTPDKEIVEDEALKKQSTWVTLANRLVPFSIDQVEVIDGTFIFELKAEEVASTFEVNHSAGMIKNITNVRDKSKPDFASADFTGKIQNQSQIHFQGSYDPFEVEPTFDADVTMQRLDVKYVDKLIRYYLPVDFEAGELDMAMELISKQGKVDGYCKIGVYNLDVFSWKQDVEIDHDNPFELLLDGITGALASFLENDDTGMVATRIPIQGDLSNIDTPVFEAIAGLLHNALIDAYKMNIEDLFSFSSNADESSDNAATQAKSASKEKQAARQQQQAPAKPQQDKSAQPEDESDDDAPARAPAATVPMP